MRSNTLLFIISGPSGSGKTTLLKKILQDKYLKHRLLRSVSFTTRPKRSGEKDKKDYFFITEKRFRSQLKKEKILEWTNFLNYHYGTFKSHLQDLLKQDRHILLCLDEKGAFKIKKLFPRRVVTIFILPPKIDSLKIRMASSERKAECDDLAQRLRLAKRQIRLSRDYDYQIVNDNFNGAARRLKDIITQEINLRRK